jgi:hypothetical protein
MLRNHCPWSFGIDPPSSRLLPTRNRSPNPESEVGTGIAPTKSGDTFKPGACSAAGNTKVDRKNFWIF